MPVQSTGTLGCGEVSEKDRGEFRSEKSGIGSGLDVGVMGRRYGVLIGGTWGTFRGKGRGGATTQTLVL